MGKALPSPKGFGRVIASNRPNTRTKPISKVPPVSPQETQPEKLSGSLLPLRLETKKTMEVGNSNSAEQRRAPLAEVVEDCLKRWFQDTLKEAKAGDAAMQVLVGQMYCSGYGVTRDAQKGRAWISRASRIRSSAWKVGDKHPGYNASDSDSDEAKGNDR